MLHPASAGPRPSYDSGTPTLYLLRHAKSDWGDPALPDRERSLARRGVRDAKRMAEHLREAAVAPALVLCSSAKRTRETLELLRPALEGAHVEVEDRLYAASRSALLERLHDIADAVDSVLLIGHNPGLQELAIELAAAGHGHAQLETKFSTCALATLTVPHWNGLEPGEATLDDYVEPKALR